MRSSANPLCRGPMNKREDFDDEIEDVVTTRKLLVTRMRTDVQLALAQHRATRKKKCSDTRASLRRRRAEITAAVGNVRYERRLMVDRVGKNISNPAVACGRHPAATQGRADYSNLRPATGLVHDSDEQNVLRAVRAHPEGLTMAEIGNQMGVDWRGLVDVVQCLAEAGTIER